MSVHPSVLEAIGNTPLIKLKGASEATGSTILGKAEFLNPGQSVKDRAALYIIRDAEQKGLLRPGGVIVEGTAGNTGIGLTLVAKALGYRTVIVICCDTRPRSFCIWAVPEVCGKNTGPITSAAAVARHISFAGLFPGSRR